MHCCQQHLGKEIREGRLQGAASLDKFATHPGPNDTVTAPLSSLYFLNEVSDVFLKQEFTRNAKYSIDQYLYLMNGHRVSKDELLDPILDDDTIDYSRESIPWEQPNTDSTEKPFQFAADADPIEVQGIKNLLARYDAQLQATLNTHPAVLDPMVLRVDNDKWKVRRNQAPARLPNLIIF